MERIYFKIPFTLGSLDVLAYFQCEKKKYSIRGVQSQNGCIMCTCVHKGIYIYLHHDRCMFTLDVTFYYTIVKSILI